MKTPLKLDRTRQAAPQVFEWLRASILSLQLAPGTALSRTELAERFELSQTPVRDALLQLAQEGLVDIFPQHATLVSRIDIASATQAHFLRCAIELEVVRTLALAAAAHQLVQVGGTGCLVHQAVEGLVCGDEFFRVGNGQLGLQVDWCGEFGA